MQTTPMSKDGKEATKRKPVHHGIEGRARLKLDGNREVRIATINIGGLLEAWDWIFELDVEILMVQETKRTKDKV